jgi:hypothetical protein
MRKSEDETRSGEEEDDDEHNGIHLAQDALELAENGRGNYA